MRLREEGETPSLFRADAGAALVVPYDFAGSDQNHVKSSLRIWWIR